MKSPDAVLEKTKTLSARYPQCFIALGVGNKVSTTTALDYCLDVLNDIRGAIREIEILSIRPHDLLGHDSVREPDADSDIVQHVLCTGLPIDWMRRHKESLCFDESQLFTKEIRGHASQSILHNEKGSMSENPWNFTFMCIVPFGLMVSVVLAHWIFLFTGGANYRNTAF